MITILLTSQLKPHFGLFLPLIYDLLFLFLSITIDATNNIILMINATSVVISIDKHYNVNITDNNPHTEMMTRQISHG